RLEYERLIHNELRVLRQRVPLTPAESSQIAPAAIPAEAFDYQRFADRFRGSEQYVRSKLQFYLPYFEGRREVLDVGCGRGEFLEMVKGRGIDLSEESVAYCRRKGLRADVADLFPYLNNLPGRALDGIFSSQVVEHLPPERLPEMIRLCAAKLARGGVLALETPNPDCLAIFATHFFLDPTHARPVPSALLAFYMEEAGMGGIEVHPLSPAVESFPEIAELPEGFRNRFFGGLDYAIVAKKL
ncbi:MAG: class I SAM-dependent methyltransferase, partial [Acidobacteriota bacterium]|nr:class I SAM-dependent methyltransferase [Acidobacteriota bacterium]